MKKVVLLLILSLIVKAKAEDLPKDCEFVPRAKASSEVMATLDAKVVGLANCTAVVSDANAVYVAKFEKLDEKKIRDFLSAHAMVIDGTAKSAKIEWESKQPLEKRQFIIKTMSPPNPSRPRVDVLPHYAFVTPVKGAGYLVFVHSGRDLANEKTKRDLKTLNDLLSTKHFTDAVAKH